MIVCGFEKFSMVDFDGRIACTVFTGGCNFRCPFCHNGALVVGNVKAQEIDVKEVFDYLKKRKGLVDAVCVTGGEPTMHKDLPGFLREVRSLGYATKLDTNGTNPQMLADVIAEGLVDYVAMDIKNSMAKYPQTIGIEGASLDDICKSVDILLNSGIDYEFRTTVIDEFHTAEDMKEIAEWISGAKRYFLQKYKDNEGCLSHGYSEVSRQKADEFVKILEDKVGKVGLRGYLG